MNMVSRNLMISFSLLIAVVLAIPQLQSVVDTVPVYEMRTVKLTETLVMKPGQILSDCVLDAKDVDGPAVLITESRMDSWPTLRNVRIFCRGNDGVVLRATDSSVNYCRLQFTVTGANHALLMESANRPVNANDIDLTCWGCVHGVVMRGGVVNSNDIHGHIHYWEKRRFDNKLYTTGVKCDGDANWFDVRFPDLPKESVPAIVFTKISARNRVVRPVSGFVDEGNLNEIVR